MARKPEPEKEADNERWLVSFADFMTLLFALFVVLFANSQSDQSMDVADLEKGITDAFQSWGLNPSGTGAVPIPMGGIGDSPRNTNTTNPLPKDPGEKGDGPGESSPALPKPNEDWLPPPMGIKPQPPPQEAAKEPLTNEGLEEMGKEIEAMLEGMKLEADIDVKFEKRGVVISLGAAGFFSSGSPDLKGTSVKTVDDIAEKLKTFMKDKSFTIRFEGHTDNIPFKPRAYSSFQNNRELSFFRARSVLNRFEKHHGFPGRNLIPLAYGETRPVATNSTPEGRAQNRRVNIVILKEEYSQFENEVSSL